MSEPLESTGVETWKLRVATLDLRPGEILVVQFEEARSHEVLDQIGKIFRDLLPSDVKVVVIGPGVELSKIAPGLA